MDTQNTTIPQGRQARTRRGEDRPAHRPLWRSILKWVLIALLVLVVVVAALAVFLLRTQAGRDIIDARARPVIEEQVRQQLGSEIDYAGLEGALPGEIIIRDLVLSEGGEPWFAAERVALDWNPLAFAGGTIDIDSFVVTGADLYRTPPPRPEQPETPEDDGGGSVPDLKIDRLAIEPLVLHEAVLGERYVLTAQASADLIGGALTSELAFRTTDDTDVVRGRFVYDPERLIADLTVESGETGLIASLARADGPVSVRLDGEGPLTAWSGTLEAEVGAYGGATATLGGDLETLSGARFDGQLRPGPGLPDVARQVAGETLALTVDTRRDGEAVLIDLTRAEGRFGDLAGTVRLASPSVEAIEADLSGTLSRPVATEFGVADLAGPVALRGQAAKDGEAWTFAGTASTPSLRASVADGRSGPDLPFAGTVSARVDGFALGNERIDPLLARGLSADGDVRLTSDTATVTDLRVASGEGVSALRVTGRAEVATETTAFDATLDVEAARAVLADLLGTGDYEGALRAQLRASGTPDDAAVLVDAALPAGRIEGQPFGEGRLVADLSGLPGAPSGEATLTSADGTYRGRLVARSEGQTIIVPELRFAAAGLSLEAEGRGNPEARTVDARLNLDAGTSTTLVTGQTVGGTLDADVRIAEDGGPVAVTANARGLRFDEITLGAAQIEANGPLSAIRYGVSLDDAALPQVFLALLNTSGVADLASPQRRIAVNELRAAVNEDTEPNTITLLAPATVEFGEVISLTEARFDWLEGATLTAEGRYAPDLWVAEVTGRGVSVPGIEAAADIDLAVDTRAATPATARIVATATPEDRGTYTLTLDGQWTGERIAANAGFASEADQLATAEIAFPAILTRTDGTLGVNLPEGGLTGRVRYDDRIAPLYAFLPGTEEYLTGALDADVALAGALTAPEARGRIALSDGRFEESTVGLVLTNLEGVADVAYTGTATEATITLTGAGADGRANSVRLNGDVRLNETASSVDVNLVLDEAQLADSATLELRSTGQLGLTGSLQALTLAGDLTIAELDAQIPSVGGDDAPEYVPVTVVRVDGPKGDLAGETAKAGDAEPPLVVALDLRINANNAIFVRGRGLTSEWRTGLTITGTTANPVIGGDVRLLDGTFDFAGRTFDLTEGRIEFDRSRREIDPRLDVEAAYDAGDVTAIIAVSGPASDPELALRSEPPRPDEDIMALILFGKQPTELTALESLQIANAVAQLTGASPLGGGGPGITDKLRSSLGLDSLSVGVGADGSAALGVGKYVTDDLYVAARQSAGETGTEVVVTYEVTDSVTLESALRPSGAQSVSANYKKDY